VLCSNINICKLFRWWDGNFSKYKSPSSLSCTRHLCLCLILFLHPTSSLHPHHHSNLSPSSWQCALPLCIHLLDSAYSSSIALLLLYMYTLSSETNTTLQVVLYVLPRLLGWLGLVRGMDRVIMLRLFTTWMCLSAQDVQLVAMGQHFLSEHIR
jgi:hypothetical protein